MNTVEQETISQLRHACGDYLEQMLSAEAAVQNAIQRIKHLDPQKADGDPVRVPSPMELRTRFAITQKQKVDVLLGRVVAQINLYERDGALITVWLEPDDSAWVINSAVDALRNVGWIVALRQGDQRDPGTWLEVTFPPSAPDCNL